ncbi:MAG: polysaccharide biosynthesis C-terminal domain-containing protein [Bacteroidetes bacterium]|nr:polysaccharide biosynthesis C-terminal domain-containing protein [Bacteroidota bacterium]
MQLSKHIGKAVWSTASRVVTVLMGFALMLPQKMIGPSQWGIYGTAQAILTSVFMLSDSIALQAMVNFGVIPERRREALTISAVTHLLFCALCGAAVYFGRGVISTILNEPQLAVTLAYFPLVVLGFLLRTYFLKVSQISIDTRATFYIEVAWSGTTVLLIAAGWMRHAIVDANDMMMISAISSGVSSVIGLAFHWRNVRFTSTINRANALQMYRLGLAQLGSAVTMVLQTQGDILILKRFASSAVVGNYDAAKRFFRGFEALRDAAVLLIYPAVAKLAAERRRDELVKLVEKMIGFMATAVVPIVLVIWLGPADMLFAWIYKGKYDSAAMIFKVLSLAALVLPFSMNTYVLGALSEARQYFRVTFVSAILAVVAMWIFVPMLGGEGAALGVVVSYLSLAILATRSVLRTVPFTITGALGRWRDAFNFVARTWRGVTQRGSRR